MPHHGHSASTPPHPRAQLGVAATALALVLALAPACDEEKLRRDQNYGTDAGLGYEGPPPVALRDGAGGGAPSDGSGGTATDDAASDSDRAGTPDAGPAGGDGRTDAEPGDAPASDGDTLLREDALSPE